MKTRRKTAKAALLCLFCALLMAALPVTAVAEEASVWNDIAYTIEGENSKTVSENGITVKVRGEHDGSTGTAHIATITLANQSGSAGELSFDWAENVNQPVNRLEINGAEASKSGHYKETIGSGESITISIITGENTSTNTLEISKIAFGKVTEPEHNYVPVVTEPTCTAEGYTTYTCTSCDEEHSYKDNIIPILPHTGVIDAAEDATCTAAGKTEGKHCSACNEVLVAQEVVPALGHTSTGTGTVTAPTCTAEGYTTHTCERCRESYTTDKTDAKGHAEVADAALDATCTTAGKTAGKHCSVCNTVLVKQEVVPALGHTEVIDEAVAATCTATGLTEGKHCSACEAVLAVQQVVPALGHTEVTDAAVAATCTTTGLTEGKHCLVCKAVLTAQREVAALGHNYESVVTNPNCTAEGYTTYTCSNCGDCYTTDVVNALGHRYVAIVIPSRCTSAGYTSYTCSCGDSYTADEVDAMGHTFNTYDAVASTCTEKGNYEYKQCSACELYFAADAAVDARNGEEENTGYIIEAMGHNLEDYPGRNPTHTQAGWKPYEACSRCDHTTKVTLPALGGSPAIENYGELIKNLEELEAMAESYGRTFPGADALGLVLGYISGRETDQNFADHVVDREENYNAEEATSPEEYLEVTALKNLGVFTLPNGRQADLGHLFGVMASLYQNSANPDAAEADGWAGGLLELVKAADDDNLSGTTDEIARVLEERYFAKDAGYSRTRLDADLDGVNLMALLGSGEYSSGKLALTMEGYFTEALSEADRAESFLQNRLSGSTTRQQIRQAICAAYNGNQAIAALKNGLTFESTKQTLAKIEEAACQVFADHLCRRAGIVGQVDLSLSANAIRARGSVSLTVALEDGFSGLSGYQFTVKYDPELFDVESIDTGGSPVELGVVTQVDARKGEITFKTNGQAGTNKELNGPMAVIKFAAKKTARGTAQFAVIDTVLNIIENGQVQTHPAVGSWKTGQTVAITPILPGDEDYDGLLSQIIVSGLEAPAKYQIPDITVDLSEGPTLNGQAAWSPEPNFGGKFAPDTVYTLSIPYVLHEYYTLDENLVVMVEGLESGSYTASLEEGFIRITFAKTELKAPTGLDLRVLNSQNEAITTAAVPYAGSTGVYTVAAWVLYDDGSEERFDGDFDCTLEGGSGTQLTQSEHGWKLTIYPAARAGAITLKIGCTPDGQQLTDQMSFALTREADRLTTLEINGEETVNLSGGTTTKQYTALGRNQYGEEMAADNLAWSLTQAVDGVSIDPATGMLTVSGRASQSVILRIDCGGIFAEKTVTLQYQPVSSGSSHRPKEEKPEEKPAEKTEEITATPEVTTDPMEEAPLTQQEPEALPLPPAAEETPAEGTPLPGRTDTQTTPEEQPAVQQEEKPRGIGGAVAAVGAAGTATAAAVLGWKWKKKRRRRII